MESNISRDHIALEAMKVIIENTVSHEQSLWNKIKVLFGGGINSTDNFLKAWIVAKRAYEYADAMIAERERTDASAEG